LKLETPNVAYHILYTHGQYSDATATHKNKCIPISQQMHGLIMVFYC